MNGERNFQQNTLFIEGGSHADVKKALRQWIGKYSSQLEPDFDFKLSKNGHGKHVIQADERLDNELFYFLVNYIKYPVGIDYKVSVEGFTTGKETGKLQNKELLVFISDSDTEYDNVMLVTEDNQCYKMEFGRKLSESKEARVYEKQLFETQEPPLILKVRKPSKKALERTLEAEKKIETRLKWMLILFISLHVFNFLIIRPFSVDRNISFENVSYFISIGISLWLFWDYKILRDNVRYLKCLGLVAAMMLYLIFLSEMKWLDVSEYEASVVIFPIILLSIQWPLRYIFIQAMNKEPVVERRPQNFPDVFYCCFLLMVPMFASLVLSVPFFKLLR